MKPIYAALPAAAVIVLSGCGPASHGTAAAPGPVITAGVAVPAASSEPADPVALLRAAGAVPDPGTRLGSHDVFGDRSAAGTLPSGTTVTVYTSGDNAAFMAEAGRPPVDDDHAVVTVAGKLAVIVLDAGESGWGKLTPAVIAGRVGGQVAGPQ